MSASLAGQRHGLGVPEVVEFGARCLCASVLGTRKLDAYERANNVIAMAFDPSPTGFCAPIHDSCPSLTVDVERPRGSRAPVDDERGLEEAPPRRDARVLLGDFTAKHVSEQSSPFALQLRMSSRGPQRGSADRLLQALRWDVRRTTLVSLRLDNCFVAKFGGNGGSVSLLADILYEGSMEGTVTALSELRYLSLQSNHIRGGMLEPLLEAVMLRVEAMDRSGDADVFTLSLQRNEIGHAGIAAIRGTVCEGFRRRAQLPGAHAQLHIDLAGCMLRDRDLAGEAPPPSSPPACGPGGPRGGLSLDLSQNHAGLAAVCAFLRQVSAAPVTGLALDGAALRGREAMAELLMSVLEHCPRLRKLSARNLRPTVEDATRFGVALGAYLRKDRSGRSLECLKFECCTLGDHGCAAIATALKRAPDHGIRVLRMVLCYAGRHARDRVAELLAQDRHLLAVSFEHAAEDVGYAAAVEALQHRMRAGGAAVLPGAPVQLRAPQGTPMGRFFWLDVRGAVRPPQGIPERIFFDEVLRVGGTLSMMVQAMPSVPARAEQSYALLLCVLRRRPGFPRDALQYVLSFLRRPLQRRAVIFGRRAQPPV